MASRGYQNKVELVSPNGSQRLIMKIPGRFRSGGKLQLSGFGFPGRNQDKRFNRLLSRGWKLLSSAQNCSTDPEEKRKEGQHGPKEVKLQKPVQKESEEVKKVAEAISITSEDYHGGNEATKDIPNSPNSADDGQQENPGADSGQDGEAGSGQEGKGGENASSRGEGDGEKTFSGRGNRGGRATKNREELLRLKKQRSSHAGRAGVYAHQPLQVSKEMLKAAEESARLLKELVGRSSQKTIQGIEVNAEKLLLALEVGDNPLPPLEEPRERPKLRVLLTPDSSGSTQNWSGLGKAWALRLSQMQDIDVVYKDNFNGSFWGNAQEPGEEARKLIAEVDVLIYLGDSDGYKLCHQYAEQGATVVALDCHCASVKKPRLREVCQKPCGGGRLYWVDRVSRKEPSTWAKALRQVLKK